MKKINARQNRSVDVVMTYKIEGYNMQLNFLGGPTLRLDTIVTHIDVWYDMDSFKTWVVTTYNKTGDQVGDSVFMHHKRDAVMTARMTQGDLGGVDKVTLSIGKRDGSY